ncbi:hypothetical protein MTR67_047925 [Solanum verrucosum]|uniref:RNase H type-1 domain-containing protein n=1 Tax=Solanum verrucosum TaxID=315347 RepID=A0AAF0UYP5_SOLVR|nr:hypothetical protein MTR67_047925 [Solanum verrucosum]
MRDNNGNFIMAFSLSVQCTNNNLTEATTVKFGIQWCISNSFKNIHIELDSMVIARMLISKDQPISR